MPWAAARDRFTEAVGARYGASYDTTIIQGLQKTTLDGYLRQVRRLARMERMRPGMGARTVLETRLMDIVDGEQSESAAKLVLSAAMLVEKMGCTKPVGGAVRRWSPFFWIEIEERRTEPRCGAVVQRMAGILGKTACPQGVPPPQGGLARLRGRRGKIPGGIAGKGGKGTGYPVA